jgi:hypothetical protein
MSEKKTIKIKIKKGETASNAELQVRINNMVHVPILRTAKLRNPKKFSYFNKNSRHYLGKLRAIINLFSISLEVKDKTQPNFMWR